MATGNAFELLMEDGDVPQISKSAKRKKKSKKKANPDTKEASDTGSPVVKQQAPNGLSVRGPGEDTFKVVERKASKQKPASGSASPLSQPSLETPPSTGDAQSHQSEPFTRAGVQVVISPKARSAVPLPVAASVGPSSDLEHVLQGQRVGATSPAGLLRAIHQLCSALDLSIAGINGEKSSSSGLAELAQTLYGAAAKKILAACQLRIERDLKEAAAVGDRLLTKRCILNGLQNLRDASTDPAARQKAEQLFRQVQHNQQTLQLSYEEAGAARIATEAVEDLKALPGAEGLGSVVAECEEELAGLLKLHQSVLREFSCVAAEARAEASTREMHERRARERAAGGRQSQPKAQKPSAQKHSLPAPAAPKAAPAPASNGLPGKAAPASVPKPAPKERAEPKQEAKPESKPEAKPAVVSAQSAAAAALAGKPVSTPAAAPAPASAAVAETAAAAAVKQQPPRGPRPPRPASERGERKPRLTPEQQADQNIKRSLEKIRRGQTGRGGGGPGKAPAAARRLPSGTTAAPAQPPAAAQPSGSADAAAPGGAPAKVSPPDAKLNLVANSSWGRRAEAVAV